MPDDTTDFGEMSPPIVLISFICVLSDGGPTCAGGGATAGAAEVVAAAVVVGAVVAVTAVAAAVVAVWPVASEVPLRRG